jgi:hypothetical protein
MNGKTRPGTGIKYKIGIEGDSKQQLQGGTG